MGQKEHEGRVGRNAPKRSLRKPTRKSHIGFVTIIVDTNETEKNYFTGLRESLPNGNQITIKRAKKTEEIVSFAYEYKRCSSPAAEIWLVFDKDELVVFDKIIEEAENYGFKVAWSNPCFEIWLHAYFGEMPSSKDSQQCVRHFKEKFKRTVGREYAKNDARIYATLEKFGSYSQADQLAERKLREAKNVCGDDSRPSLLAPASCVFELVRQLKK